uniref:Type III-B CRISPR-associated protein Cas10/Cmr2 n=1 Tax=Thermorudis peleae TaxID=1382356 RepID=A0A831TJW7_9BACT
MSKAVLRFAFSPVQSFIAEARRTSDLFAGSRILAELASAAAQSIRASGGELVFPASLDGNRHDMPNVIVAVVPWEQVERIAEEAESALRGRWDELAEEAKRTLSRLGPVDRHWDETWHRQVEHLWEVYWAAARLDGSYREAFRRAAAAVASAKRLRPFAQVEEPGIKDSLSGSRSALCTERLGANEYWQQVRHAQRGVGVLGKHERLDAVGSVKRFSGLGREESFPSLPTIAARPFLQHAETQASQALEAYARALAELFQACQVDPRRMRRRASERFPYDGGFLFPNRLERLALAEELDVTEDRIPEPERAAALRALQSLYREARWPSGPSPYVAVLVLDGDSMGARIDALLEGTDPPEAHREFSEKLATFAAKVRELEKDFPRVEVVYNGGDDVLALAPAQDALGFARRAAHAFHEETGGSASAGTAVAHWLQPLGDALKAARRAEGMAKQVTGKGAVCIELQRRSGEVTTVRAKWTHLEHLDIASLVELFQVNRLSGRLPYALRESARAFTGTGPAFEAVVKRVVARQGNWPDGSAPERETLVTRLTSFASALDGAGLAGAEELVGWLVVARFLAAGGEE